MSTNRPHINIAILAAGRGRRFGDQKQLAVYNGKPLIELAATAALNCGAHSVTLIVPPGGASIIHAAAAMGSYAIVNEQTNSGIGDSIALATRTLRRLSDAIVFMLADQPLVTAAHVSELIGTWNEADNAIVSTRYAGTIGPPVLFPRATFDALSDLSGDAGAKLIFSNSAFDVSTIQFEAAALDVDTVSDLDELP